MRIDAERAVILGGVVAVPALPFLCLLSGQLWGEDTGGVAVIFPLALLVVLGALAWLAGDARDHLQMRCDQRHYRRHHLRQVAELHARHDALLAAYTHTEIGPDTLDLHHPTCAAYLDAMALATQHRDLVLPRPRCYFQYFNDAENDSPSLCAYREALDRLDDAWVAVQRHHVDRPARTTRPDSRATSTIRTHTREGATAMTDQQLPAQPRPPARPATLEEWFDQIRERVRYEQDHPLPPSPPDDLDALHRHLEQTPAAPRQQAPGQPTTADLLSDGDDE